jgi:S1-C subfamily serine protease
MPKTDWDIPSELQPDPADYTFDLDKVLSAVVGLRATAPADAFTASALGTEREGSGVVIDDDGLLLTMGYLITEAETVWLTSHDGRAVPGHALAFDNETGFGLVQPLGKLGLPKLELGESSNVELGDPVLFASAGGRRHAIETKVVGRQEFAGYWEYLLDDAIFTAPAHPFWGGAALIGQDATLLGVGSLILQQGDEKGRRHDMNMVVPIDGLRPILDDLRRYGRVNRPARPWLGVYAMEDGEAVVIGGLADGGPADRAGLRTGDHVLAVEDEEVTDLAELWRSLWACGPAGSRVTLMVQRDERRMPVSIATTERRTLLKAPRMH